MGKGEEEEMEEEGGIGEELQLLGKGKGKVGPHYWSKVEWREERRERR